MSLLTARAVAIPAPYQLKVEDMPLGTLRIARRQRFEESELAMLEQLIGVIVYPLRNALLYRRAQHDAATDPLTGLSNRGVFDDALPREISRALRYGTALTLLMVDVDNLKHINDRAGHSAGDRGLQQVAGMLRAGVRDSDQVFRYAGDEFAVLLVGGDATTAREVAERLRSRVDELPADVRRRPPDAEHRPRAAARHGQRPDAVRASRQRRCTAPNRPAATACAAPTESVQAIPVRNCCAVRQSRVATRSAFMSSRKTPQFRGRPLGPGWIHSALP